MSKLGIASPPSILSRRARVRAAGRRVLLREPGPLARAVEVVREACLGLEAEGRAGFAHQESPAGCSPFSAFGHSTTSHSPGTMIV
jgi:hypothetical protein